MSHIRLWGPVVAFLAMIAWSNIPPYRGHVKDEKRALLVWQWELYLRGGGEVCDVGYFDMNSGGDPVKRWELLGFERPGEMDGKLARTREGQLRSEYRRVCKAMTKAGDSSPNVEVFARCGLDDDGWREVEQRGRNVCGSSKAKPKKPKAKAPSKAGKR